MSLKLIFSVIFLSFFFCYVRFHFFFVSHSKSSMKSFLFWLVFFFWFYKYFLDVYNSVVERNIRKETKIVIGTSWFCTRTLLFLSSSFSVTFCERINQMIELSCFPLSFVLFLFFNIKSKILPILWLNDCNECLTYKPINFNVKIINLFCDWLFFFLFL